MALAGVSVPHSALALVISIMQMTWLHNYFQIECIDVCGKNLYIGTNDW